MNNINYIKTSYDKIIINDETIINQSINNYLNYILLQQITTLEGRVDAIKKIYGFKKLVPIYINKNNILFPVYNLKEYENIYINACSVIGVYKRDSKTVIEFVGFKKLIINKSIKQILKNFERALSINHNS